MKHAKNFGELKAISQNMMHESTDITDRLYGRHNNDDVRKVVLGKKELNNNTNEIIQEFLSWRENKNTN